MFSEFSVIIAPQRSLFFIRVPIVEFFLEFPDLRNLFLFGLGKGEGGDQQQDYRKFFHNKRGFGIQHRRWNMALGFLNFSLHEIFTRYTSVAFLLMFFTRKPPSSGISSLKSKLLHSFGSPEKIRVNQKSFIGGTGVQYGKRLMFS